MPYIENLVPHCSMAVRVTPSLSDSRGEMPRLPNRDRVKGVMSSTSPGENWKEMGYPLEINRTFRTFHDFVCTSCTTMEH